MTTFAQLSADHGVRSDITASFEREWESLQRPGSHFSSDGKVAIAAGVRAARNGMSVRDGLPPSVAEAVETLTTSAASVRRSWVEKVVAAGLTMPGYVETVSLVSRISAVDAFHRVLTLEPPALPEPGSGEPTGDFNPMATPSKAFVPMTRGTSIWWSLTLVPEAYTRMEDLHCVLYVSPEQMQAPGSPRTLSRPQMELLASRTSAVNECFY